jgi:periplasmic protein TonB
MNTSKKNHKSSGKNKQILKPKKNPQADVNRNGSIYFAVGLLLMLLASYTAINYKSYDKNNVDIGMLDLGELDIEDIPIIKEVKKLPPPVVVITPDTDIKEDDDDVIETVIDRTDTDEEDKIAEIIDIVVIDEPEDIDVPFAFIENVPIYPGCEKGNNLSKRKCMSDKINKFVQRKFNTDLAEKIGLTGKQRISVVFKIDKNGDVVGVRSRAPHPKLEQEAARVINLLPKMKPGKQRGVAVNVSYSLPIVFLVQD